MYLFSFNSYYKPNSNYNIRKFDFLLLNETPYIDETLKIVGHYQELLSQKEIDDVDIKNDEYDIFFLKAHFQKTGLIKSKGCSPDGSKLNPKCFQGKKIQQG